MKSLVRQPVHYVQTLHYKHKNTCNVVFILAAIISCILAECSAALDIKLNTVSIVNRTISTTLVNQSRRICVSVTYCTSSKYFVLMIV